ncbi:caspase domain-containing protein [Streptomyces nigra]|uniref:Caspase family protein n=1 Tax=Streptomyces nigra TaxID=1827580 RepID=A0ABZ1IWW7_9ACTN
MIRLPDRERSRAFLFGTASYESDEFPDLPAVANNLEDLHAVLTSPDGAFAAEHCTVLLDPPDAIPLYDALHHQATEATDTLLIYFSGHGLRKLFGDGLHLALPHTRSVNQSVSGFDYDRLREVVHSSRAKNKIVIVDSCYSGRAIQSMSGAAPDLDIEGSCLLTSATGNSKALAPPGERHTTFSGALIHLLQYGTPEAGPLLSFGIISDELRSNALRQNGIPIPGQQFHGTAQHIALARNAAAPSADAAAPPPTVPPPPRPTARHAYVSRPLPFAGTSHATKEQLAETIRGHWGVAADRFFRRMGTPSHPSESWGELRSWLRQFNDPLIDDVEGRIVLIDRYLSDPGVPHDHKVLQLLHWLDPQGPAVYRGRPITYAALANACLRRYVGGGRRDAELLEDLSGPHRLLDALSGFAALGRLRGVQRKWEKALKAWQAADSTSWPTEVRQWAADVGPGALLAGLLPQEHLVEARRRLPAKGRPPAPSIDWYSQLLRAAGGRETLLGGLVEAEWSQRARQEGLAKAREGERRRRAAEEARKRQQEEERRAQEEARKAEELRLQRKREREKQRLAEEPRLREERRRAEEERQRRARQAEAEEQERQRRLGQWRAAEAVRLRPAARAGAVVRAFTLGAVWALFPIVAVWLTWWFSSYEFDAAQLLSWLACVVSAAALYRLAPCAYRLGAAFKPRLRTPATWLPPARTALGTGAVLLVYGLIGGDSSSRASEIKADSDYLREVGLGDFLTYVGQDGSRASFTDILTGLLAVLAAAACVWLGLHAGRTTARGWEERYTRAQEEARGPARQR